MTLQNEGILLVNKPKGKTSFSLIRALRKQLGIKKIGHAGTLDPFATGVMVLLVGRPFTKLSDQFLTQDKEYQTQVQLGIETDSYDCTGEIIAESNFVPTLNEVERALTHFQGTVEQIPPMFSAKKINGKKLYEFARKGKVIERKAAIVKMEVRLLNYHYPYLDLHISCSKGTYVRSIAHDVGQILNTGAHLSSLTRVRSGPYTLEECLDGSLLFDPESDLSPYLRKYIA